MSWLKSMMEKEPPEPENPIGIIVIGNIEPDMHDTAKEAVRRSLKRAGFKTIDVGKSVAPQVFVDKAKENNANIIAISVNTVPAKNNLPKLVLIPLNLISSVLFMICLFLIIAYLYSKSILKITMILYFQFFSKK